MYRTTVYGERGKRVATFTTPYVPNHHDVRSAIKDAGEPIRIGTFEPIGRVFTSSKNGRTRYSVPGHHRYKYCCQWVKS